MSGAVDLGDKEGGRLDRGVVYDSDQNLLRFADL